MVDVGDVGRSHHGKTRLIPVPRASWSHAPGTTGGMHVPLAQTILFAGVLPPVDVVMVMMVIQDGQHLLGMQAPPSLPGVSRYANHDSITYDAFSCCICRGLAALVAH